MALELLDTISVTDDHGRHRDTAGGEYSRVDIAEPLVKLGTLLQTLEKKDARYNYRHYARTIFDNCEAALRGDSRPIDRYLDHYLTYTNFDGYKQRQSGSHRDNRVVVDATMTSKDNLSVRLWMRMLSEQGRWVPAPEWKDIPYYGWTATMERPDDEVLFIRDVNRLIAKNTVVYDQFEKRDAIHRKVFEASCELVNALFWVTVQRLAQRFEVTLSRYILLLRESKDGPILGLQISDAVDERIAETERSIANFEMETGWTAEGFWVACQNPTAPFRRYASEGLVRRLRAKASGTVKLTAGEVERRLRLLSLAEAYGLWKPALASAATTEVCISQPELPEAPADDASASSPDPSQEPQAELAQDHESPDGPAATQDAKATPALAPHLRKTFRRSQPAENSQPIAPAPKSRFDPPSYDGLRSAPWTEDLTNEFAVPGTHEFVALLNDIRKAENRLPVPQGSFPAKASDLVKLVQEARAARARQLEQPPDSPN